MPSVWKFKAVKAKKLKDKEIKRKIRNAVFRVGRGVLSDFKRTTTTWEHKPKFELLTSVRQDSEPGFVVHTDDQIYRWVNDGTRAHEYGPVISPVLIFQPDYTPKTESEVIGSRAGGKSGPYIRKDWVKNPGIEPRHFDQVIAQKWEKRWRRAIEEAIKSGVAASGHKL